MTLRQFPEPGGGDKGGATLGPTKPTPPTRDAVQPK
jgi:hypothetical protein